MAERKAVNKYYPPDWDPRKGSVNKRVGQHPLRDRAKKLGQGILVIRFELPYNIWCGGCGSHVGMGVRYNAEKSKVGNYYTTPIYKFRMKCHLCDNYFEIQTDPKNHDYVILCGARRKEQRWDPVANEQIVPEDKATQKKMAMDAMYKLEHGSDDKVKGKEKVRNLAELESSRLSMKEDYLLNRMARDKFRAEKKVLKDAADADKSLLERGSLDIDLLEETESDRNLAGLLKYTVTSSFEEKQKEKRKSIEQRPLFGPAKTSLPASSPTSSLSSTAKSSDSNESSENSKLKLSETLRLSQRDPFTAKKPVKLFSTSISKPLSLGIRLKHSRVMKKTTKPSISKKTLVSHLQNRSPAKCTKDIPQNKSESLGEHSTEYVSSSNTDHSDLFPSVLGTADKSFTMSRELLQSSSASESDGAVGNVLAMEKDIKTNDISGTSGYIEALGESTKCNSGFSFNASGLSMLMSSYDEQDSDSYDSA